ncbi:MAG: DUF2460 domain-containing protein [Caulobacteraceae bacterium]
MTIEVFPQFPGQGFWALKTPSWNTTIKKAASGRQIRITQQGQPIWQFKVGYGVIRDQPSVAEIDALFAFFNDCQGQLNDFYLLDPFDNVVTSQIVAQADGVSTSYQLTRTVGGSSAFPFVEPIYGVVGIPGEAGGPEVLINGAAATGVAFGPLGVITFPTPPVKGQVITWSGRFYFLCHFTQDAMDPAQMMAGLWSMDGVEFESVIP